MSSLDFTYKQDPESLEVNFRTLPPLPSEKPEYDFGEGEPEIGYNVKHIYAYPGYYNVKLTSGEDSTTKQVTITYPGVKTHLDDSIYNLIDTYIPSSVSSIINQDLSDEEAKVFINKQKKAFITKWQLYLGPLVDHPIPPELFQDELAYEGLENQLIVELAAYDFILIGVSNLLALTGYNLANLAPGTQFTAGGSRGTTPKNEDTQETSKELETKNQQNDRIKRITTGPTEVEYFDETSDSYGTWWYNYFRALQPGGILDELKSHICMLAKRLDIYLPICDQVTRPKVPKVVNRRRPGPLGGPNPVAPLTNHGRLK